MLGRNRKLNMALQLNSDKASRLMPPVRIVWIALLGFVLGTVLCSFGPPSHEELLKERKTMSNTTKHSMTSAVSLEKASGYGTRIETASFAMG